MFFQLLKVLKCVINYSSLIQAMCDLLFKSISDLLPCHIAIEKLLLLKLIASFSCLYLKKEFLLFGKH